MVTTARCCAAPCCGGIGRGVRPDEQSPFPLIRPVFLDRSASLVDRDNDPMTEEPDEATVSRPVLEGGEGR